MSQDDTGSLAEMAEERGGGEEPQKVGEHHRQPSQDSIVLHQMATLSMDMFTPSDFKGKFRKIQPRKRPTIAIIREGNSPEPTPAIPHKRLCLSQPLGLNLADRQHRDSHHVLTPLLVWCYC